VARHRPPAAIVAVAPDEATRRRLALVWGVQAVPRVASVHLHEDLLEAAVRSAFVHGGVAAGELVVVVAGHPVEGGGHFPTIRVVRVGDGGRSESALG
jgi:pyruvate kinase